jgi:microcystin-dependent protein
MPTNRPTVEKFDDWMRDLERRANSLERRARRPRMRAEEVALFTEPPGVMKLWPTATPPTGYLICDGAAVDRVTYAALFTVLGTAYGVGDGSTTFNIPNLKGRVPAGFDSGQVEFDALGETGGAKTHTLSTAEMPQHQHATDSLGRNLLWFPGSLGTVGVGAGTNTTGVGAGEMTDLQGGGQAHNNLQPYVVLNYIIKT